MTFRKAQIPIRLIDDVVDYVDGYIFEAVFSTGQIFEIGVYKREFKTKDGVDILNPESARLKTDWVVTDLNTGRIICKGHTRKNAVEKFQNMYCSKLERMVLSNEHYSTDPSCHENNYEHMTAEFQKLLAGVDNA